MQAGQAPSPHAGGVSGNPHIPDPHGFESWDETPNVDNIFSTSTLSHEGQFTAESLEKTNSSKEALHFLQ